MIFHENPPPAGCQQTNLVKYQALFDIFEKVAKFEIFFCPLLLIIGGPIWVNLKFTSTSKF